MEPLNQESMKQEGFNDTPLLEKNQQEVLNEMKVIEG